MIDIFERLRNYPKVVSTDGLRFYKTTDKCATCAEAADVIERLRATLVEVGEWGNLEGSVAEEYDQDHGPGSFKKLTRGSTP